MKSKIKPIYGELKGVLSEAPKGGQLLHEPYHSLWERFNKLVGKLKEITEDEDYISYQLKPRHMENWGWCVESDEYRAKVNSLITRLHATYFDQEPEPFSGIPTNVTNVSQSQNVSVQVYVELGMQLQAATKKAETPQEKSFIEGLKDKISTVKSFVDFGLLMATLANQYGITPERIKTLFGMK